MTPTTLAEATTHTQEKTRTGTVTYSHWAITRHVREKIPNAQGIHVRINAPQDVVKLCLAMAMDVWAQESLLLILLDTQHNVIERAIIEVTRGSLDSSIVHPRDVFRAALAASAASIILVHNHPSGDVTPSPEDRLITSQIGQAGQMLGIPLRDHIIIGQNRHYSFNEAGELFGMRR